MAEDMREGSGAPGLAACALWGQARGLSLLQDKLKSRSLGGRPGTVTVVNPGYGGSPSNAAYFIVNFSGE